MGASALPIEPMSDSAIPYTNYRVALATAILGSIGATSAWIALLAIETGDWHLLVTIVVGAVVGLAAHWTQHYVRVAMRERSAESGTRDAEHHQRGQPLAALLWAGSFAFLGLATEHLVAHMVTEFLRPFLASFASLLPAGAILGWTMSRGRPRDENLVQLIANGFFIGATIAVVTGLVWTLSFGTAPWIALISWWGLIGIGTRALTRPERNAVRVGDPIAAVALVFVMTFLVNLLPLTESSYNKLGPFKSMALIVRTMAAGVQQSPSVPAKFWNEAEHELAVERGEADSAAIAKPRVARASDTSAVRGALHVDLKRAADDLTAPPPSDDLASRWSSLTRASWSELFRSWLVIVLFAFGVGLAPQVERLLRPIDYPSSETYRNDIELTIFMASLLVLACAVAHFGAFAFSDVAYTRPGQIVTAADGARLNIYCIGSGAPTVVFESGWEDWAPAWSVVQPRVAKWTRACSYDRAGTGLSGAGPMPRTSVRIAGELHSALASAGFNGPYILVGHAFGGDAVRTFADLYMADVAGLVLVEADPSDVEPQAMRDDEHSRQANFLPRLRECRDSVASAKPLPPLPARAGQPDRTCAQQFFRGVPEAKWSEELNAALLRTAQTKGAMYDAFISEMEQMSWDEQWLTEHRDSLGARPVRVLTTGNHGVGHLPAPDAQDSTHLEYEHQVALAQSRWLELSSNAKQIFVQQSSEYVQFDQPDTLVSVIREVYDESRRLARSSPQP